MIGIPLLITITITVVLYLLAKRNTSYITEVSNMNKKEYPLREVRIIGLLIIDKFGLEKFKNRSRAIYEKMFSMYGLEVQEKFRWHVAYKLTLAIIAINAVYFLMLASGEFNVIFIIAGPAVAVGTYIFTDSIEEENFKKRSKAIRYDFPEFLTKLVLLVNAGLTLERAWWTILKDVKGEPTILIKELTKTYNDMSSNIPKSKCLNDLSKRCKTPEVSKFTSIVLQNISRGSDSMVFMLQQLSDECWEERKQMAKQKGEEASTKLLFPMMLMLVAVFLVVLVPAMMQLFAL